MAVQSSPLVNGQEVKSSKPGALFRSGQIRQARGWFERIMALMVLALSLFGTVLTWAGGYVLWAANPWDGRTWGLAVLTQATLTVLQWMYRVHGMSRPEYLIPLAIDVGLTIWGYGWVVAPWLAGQATKQGAPVDVAPFVAWIVIALASFGMAWYPENRLID